MSDPFPWDLVLDEGPTTPDNVEPEQVDDRERPDDRVPPGARTSSDDPDDPPFPTDQDAPDDLDLVVEVVIPDRGEKYAAPAGETVDAEIVDDDDLVDAEIPDDETTTDVEVSAAVIDLRDADVLLSDLGGDPGKLQTVASSMKETVLEVVRRRGDVRRKARIERLDGASPTSSTDVRKELAGAADDADVLTALAGAFTAGAVEAKGIAGELLDELPGRGGKPRQSMKAADGHGFEITLKREARKELDVTHDEVVDVLVSALLASAQEATTGGQGPLAAHVMPAKVYADAARTAIAAYRDLLSTNPTYRSTALDSLATRLEDADDDTLAVRLRKAYRRVEKGEPTVKIDRKPIKVDDEEAGK